MHYPCRRDTTDVAPTLMEVSMKLLAKGRLRPEGRLLLRTFLVLSMLLLGALPVAAQTDVTGFWVLSVPTGDGNFMKTFFDLKQSGEQVTGTAWIRYGKSTISEGSFRDGKLHLAVIVSPRNPERRVLYDGTLQGDKFRLTVHFPGRDAAWALPSGPRRTRSLPRPACPCRNCTTCPITAWPLHLPWAGTVGTSLPAGWTT